MRLTTPTVAVIDIGSNSIKGLVAARRADGQVESLEHRTLDARISAGISQHPPRLGESGMAAGVAAVTELVAMARAHQPEEIVLVATSAVRDAANGAEFRERVRAVTGLTLRILSGDEEARFIGLGLLCDPALTGWTDFHVFDLGGGSLECLSFANRSPIRACSLPLGCVRLSERFVGDLSAPLAAEADAAIRAHVGAVLHDAGLTFEPRGWPAVFSGGTITTSRAIVAEARGIGLHDTAARVTTELLVALHRKLARLPLADRRLVPGLPPRRADVMPTALATVLALADFGGFTAFQHSFFNLRWGIAAARLADAGS